MDKEEQAELEADSRSTNLHSLDEIIGLHVDHKRRNGIPSGIKLIRRRVTVLGDSTLCAQVSEVLRRDFMHAIEVADVSWVERRAEPRNQPRNEVLESALREAGVEVVYVALGSLHDPSARMLIRNLVSAAASIYVVARREVASTMPNNAWADLGEFKCACILDEMPWGSRVTKRSLDLVVGSLMLLGALPAMVLVALAVKFSSPGPVFFRQMRYGLDGRVIKVWKFRTMRVTEDSFNIMQSARHDARITPIGGFLRRTSLDELPQLFGVLGGQMSLVGPRPMAIAHNEQYRNLIFGYMARHKVKPGITGWAQVNGLRGETASLSSMEARIEHDIEYVRRWSLLLDLRILLQTLFTVLKRENAY